ncbi:MAG: thiamine-phosphate kinase, partial [Bacteroidales bacterium]|nr:thiamine-phosphate kinase [Bacteroidales bacterium]
IAGFRELAGRFGVALLGGDTSASPDKLFINVTLLGSCDGGKALKRSGARPGDLVCVTGTLGDSGAGLRLIQEQASGAATAESGTARYLLRRHCKPEPRVAEGLALAGILGVHSMMDVSDGVASDLRHILDASGCLGAEIETGSLPLSGELLEICRERGWEAARFALCAGEDYELLFTIAPEALGSVQAALEAAGGVSATVIGRITETGTPLCWKGWKGEPPRGFTHF